MQHSGARMIYRAARTQHHTSSSRLSFRQSNLGIYRRIDCFLLLGENFWASEWLPCSTCAAASGYRASLLNPTPSRNLGTSTWKPFVHLFLIFITAGPYVFFFVLFQRIVFKTGSQLASFKKGPIFPRCCNPLTNTLRKAKSLPSRRVLEVVRVDVPHFVLPLEIAFLIL